MRPDARVGTGLGSYHIEEVLGRGGMGVVYRAEHVGLKRKVALKLLAPELADEEGFRARFLRESQMAASIDHPNIIPIYEAGEIEGEFFLAMRYVPGSDLASRLKAGPLDASEAARLLGQVASALDAAHAEGLVHRDVKPGNILIASGRGEEAGDHVYLTDFGLTKRRDSRSGLTQAGSFLGSLDYIAPEQIEGRDVDGRADLYALGCMAYHCLTGEIPFPKETDVAAINAHLREAPPSARARRTELPPKVDAVLTRAMAKKPDQRYPSGAAFVRALREALGLHPTETRSLPIVRVGGGERWPILVAAAVGVLLIGAVGLALAMGAGTPTATPTQVGQATPSATSSSSAFPNTAEQSLLARLPAQVARNCVRTPEYVPQGEDAVYETRPTVASLRCDLGAEGGAHVVWFQEYSVVSPDDRTNAARFVLHRVAALRGATSGDCARDATGLGTWSVGGTVVGSVTCYQLSDTSESWTWWTYDEERTLARAMRRDLDHAALYRWWQGVAPFVRTD